MPVDDRHRNSAERLRSLIESRPRDPALFHAALLSVPPTARDACVDWALGLGALPEDGPALPSGCVPYLPCSVVALLRLVQLEPVARATKTVGEQDVSTRIHEALVQGADLVWLGGVPELGRIMAKAIEEQTQ